MNKNLIEKIAPQLTELMIKKMETLTEEWRKPWIADLAHGLPRNLRHALPGREYPDAAVPLGDRRLQYAAFYDVQAGQGGGSEHPQRLRFVPGLLLETVYPP